MRPRLQLVLCSGRSTLLRGLEDVEAGYLTYGSELGPQTAQEHASQERTPSWIARLLGSFSRRPTAWPSVVPGALSQGLTIVEQADRVASVLEPIGLVNGFARLVVLLGHAAHDSRCACRGRNSGHHARAIAAMANTTAVRTRLRIRGIAIPDDTWFVGGVHEAASAGAQLADLAHAPRDLGPELHELSLALDPSRVRAQR